MKYSQINNSEQNPRTITRKGVCPFYKKEAKVTSYYYGRKMCVSDLEKTYMRSGENCSLMEKTTYTSCPHTDTCPLVGELYL